LTVENEVKETMKDKKVNPVARMEVEGFIRKMELPLKRK
jgi:hypothetical protein